MTPAQLVGFRNNVKGIAHELRYERTKNSEDDEFAVELFEATNHAGADIRLTDKLTGEQREFQFKATSYERHVRDHLERHVDIPVMTTTEVASEAGFATTGIANETLERDIDSTLKELEEHADSEILDSMALAGLVTLSRNVNSLLVRGPDQAVRREKLVSQGVRAALVAGIASLLI